MAAPTNGRVLIYGENGTGKELVARSIHALSRAPQRAVRRGQLRRDSRGADRERAVRPRAGRLHRRRRAIGAAASRLADGGTIFLDEIGDMSLKTQAKVLRVLQEQVVEPVGGARQRPGRRARARGHQQGPARPRSAPDASARTCTSASTSSRSTCRRCASATRTSRGWPRTSCRSSRASTAGGRRRDRSGRAGRAAPLRAGRATCASCATSIERLLIMVPGDAIVESPHLSFLHGAARRRRAWPDAERPVAAAARGARALRARLHPAHAGRRSRATCRAPPRCSASSAATCTGRCGPSASRRRGAAAKRRPATPAESDAATGGRRARSRTSRRRSHDAAGSAARRPGRARTAPRVRRGRGRSTAGWRRRCSRPRKPQHAQIGVTTTATAGRLRERSEPMSSSCRRRWPG